MNRSYKLATPIATVLMLLAFGAGCSSSEVLIVANPLGQNQQFEMQSLGRVEGRASGVRTGFIPIALNSRTERAYNRALAQAPGAKALRNVTIQEKWFWFYLGDVRSVTVTGEAVK